jgi:hypothetical protein
MSDVAAIQNLVQKKPTQNEIAKVIVGQDAVVDQILICIFQVDMLYWLVFLDWHIISWKRRTKTQVIKTPGQLSCHGRRRNTQI